MKYDISPASLSEIAEGIVLEYLGNKAADQINRNTVHRNHIYS